MSSPLGSPLFVSSFGFRAPLQVNQLLPDTIALTADTLMDSMSLTPGPGNYLVWWSSTIEIDIIATVFVTIYIGGLSVATTVRSFETGSTGIRHPISTMAYVIGIGAGPLDTIELRWRISALPAIATVQERLLTALQVP